MPSLNRKSIIVSVLDLIIVLIPFFFIIRNDISSMWGVSLIGSILWVIISILTAKLKFEQYKRIRYALLSIVVIDILLALLIYLVNSYCSFVALDSSALFLLICIIAFEFILYYAYRSLVLRKIPYFFEENIQGNYKEIGINRCAKISSYDGASELKFIFDSTRDKNESEAIKWLEDSKANLKIKTLLSETNNADEILQYANKEYHLIIAINRLNWIRHLNTYLRNINICLEDGDCFVCCCKTSISNKQLILESNPKMIGTIFYFFSYLWHRACAKIKITRGFYFWFTKGEKRVLTRVEVLGRIYRSGFSVINEEVRNGVLYISSVKVKAPITDDKPSNGLLIRLKRVGKGGKLIGVYKLRTMHSYSEYLQPYIYQYNDLQDGGKIKDDYRVNLLGTISRKAWIDELPMLLNLLRGHLKIVGVRPLSQHFFSLYDKDIQELRIKTKPGLVPPYYSEDEIPKNLEEVQANERRYLESYLKNPIKTDWVYFWRAFRNIVFRGKRSK